MVLCEDIFAPICFFTVLFIASIFTLKKIIAAVLSLQANFLPSPEPISCSADNIFTFILLDRLGTPPFLLSACCLALQLVNVNNILRTLTCSFVEGSGAGTTLADDADARPGPAGLCDEADR